MEVDIPAIMTGMDRSAKMAIGPLALALLATGCSFPLIEPTSLPTRSVQTVESGPASVEPSSEMDLSCATVPHKDLAKAKKLLVVYYGPHTTVEASAQVRLDDKYRVIGLRIAGAVGAPPDADGTDVGDLNHAAMLVNASGGMLPTSKQWGDGERPPYLAGAGKAREAALACVQ
jgi:hypothetical protein